jgi:hypothetical protein
MIRRDIMANKKVEKKLKKYIKKLPTLTKVIAVLVFLVSLIGTFGVSFVIQKNDKFELKGEKVITMYVGGSYTEPSLNYAVECISFGRNVINTVSINESETTYNKDTSPLEAGVYYIVYNTSDFKYSEITRIRKIVVNEVEVNGDVVGDNNG